MRKQIINIIYEALILIFFTNFSFYFKKTSKYLNKNMHAMQKIIEVQDQFDHPMLLLGKPYCYHFCSF